MKDHDVSKIMKQVAKQNGVSVKEVRRQIKLAIAEAGSDPRTRHIWDSYFGKNVTPTIEEFMGVMAEQMLNGWNNLP